MADQFWVQKTPLGGNSRTRHNSGIEMCLHVSCQYVPAARENSAANGTVQDLPLVEFFTYCKLVLARFQSQLAPQVGKIVCCPARLRLARFTVLERPKQLHHRSPARLRLHRFTRCVASERRQRMVGPSGVVLG